VRRPGAARLFVAETGQRCRDCGAFHYPPRTLCRICRSRHFTAVPLSGRGIVHALRPLAVVSALPTQLWVAVWVELEEGVLIRAQLPADNAVVGLPVELLTPGERMRQPNAPLGHVCRAREPGAPSLRLAPVHAYSLAPTPQPASSRA
jgi:uncharacterized OB-fold protein